VNTRTLALLPLLLGLTLGGCVTTPTPDEPTAADSTTTGSQPTPAPDRPTLAAEFVDRIDGSTATIPLTTAALRLLRGTDAGLHHNTTHNAYVNLIEGTKDVIFVTAPSTEELALAADAGIDLEVIPVVKDALVFLANTANPVDSLTKAQVKDIYTGQLTNWAQVGGADADIIAYQRPVNSGSQTLFLALAMGDTTPVDAPTELRPGGMEGLIDAVSLYDNSADALGYSVYYYAQEMYTYDNVKLLGIDGVAPTTESISDETYPYLTYYYAVVRAGEPAGSPARQLIDWFLGSEGQQIASGTGYVPLAPGNIVPRREEYGYAGSTPENTTQSNGTGGPQGHRAPILANPCTSEVDPLITDCFVHNTESAVTGVTIPGYPATEAAVTAWLDDLAPVPTHSTTTGTANADFTMATLTQWSATTIADMFAIERKTIWPVGAGTVITRDAALFALTDGHRIALSDLFYDGVNYIGFINRYLVNPDTNQALGDCASEEVDSCEMGSVSAPFTGLPATYDLVTLLPWPNARLSVQFPAGNPFLTRWDKFLTSLVDDSFVLLNLPADLSPYGDVWRIDQTLVGTTKVDHVVRAAGGPDPVDDLLNQGIDAYAREHPDAITIQLTVEGGIVTANADDRESVTFDFATGARLT
jgi:phosphate transport system substrate-binding protein